MVINKNLVISVFSENKTLSQSPFSRSIRRLEQDVLRMGTLVEESFRLSHQCLFDRDLEASKQIKDLEEQIDEYYRKIELDCVSLIAAKTPVAKEIRLLSAYMQLVRDLERIGDYAREISEIAVKLFAYPSHTCLHEIEIMSNHAQLMLATSLVALADLDVNTGNKVKVLDDTIDNAYEQVYQILACQRDIKGSVEPILLLGLLIRHLERMADHATNIGNRVSYIVTGNRN